MESQPIILLLRPYECSSVVVLDALKTVTYYFEGLFVNVTAGIRIAKGEYKISVSL